jgi:hypothetical protein
MSILNKFFQHRNGNYYYVLNTSIHTETKEKLVNYMMLYETQAYPFGSIWSRPMKMWDEIVEGKPRFVEVVPPKEILIISAKSDITSRYTRRSRRITMNKTEEYMKFIRTQ